MVCWLRVCTGVATVIGLLAGDATHARAADIYVGPGGNLQAAIDAAQPGDRILVAPGTTFSGNFSLPNKGSSDRYITIRSAASDALLPPDGVRVTPADLPNLPIIRSPNTAPALRTAAGAHHWRLQWLAFGPNDRGYNDIIALGAGSTQDTLAKVPHHLVLDRVYVFGHPIIGQKRGISLNSGRTWIVNSYIADIKGVGFDTQAIQGHNGPGPWIVVNNYLEGAGENVLVGGADPRITNLIPSDLEFSRNHMAKPVAWRSPILSTPTGLKATAGTGGSLPAGTYSYRVTATLRTAQDVWAFSARSVEVVTTVGSGGRVRLTWTPVPNAQAYRVYRGTSAGSQTRYFDTTTASYTDSGQSAGVADTGTWITGTRWTVKNIFELKSGQRVLVDGNVMEHNWLQAQNGYAILFTPRNQDGGAPWTAVRDVTFTHNIVRHSGSAVNISGYDSNHPSQQTRRITIRNNVFYDISGANWGGDGRFVLAGNQPRDLVIDHNTVLHTSTVLYAHGTSSSGPRPIYGLVLTNNLFRHNEYGILGEGRGIGNETLNTWFPDAVVLRNTFAGGKAWQYPANNEFPSVSAWQAQFVNLSSADFRLIATSPYVGTATDGLDLGARMDVLRERTQVALSGRESNGTGIVPVAVVTSALPPAGVGTPYAATMSASGGSGGYVWGVASGTLPGGLVLNATTGTISGTPTLSGTSSFTAWAADVVDTTNVATRAMHIAVNGVPPQVVLTSPASGAVITGTSVALGASASDADGAVMRVDFFAGSTQVGTSVASPWRATWSGVSPGSYQLTAVATDSDGLWTASAPISIAVQSATTSPSPPPPVVKRPAGEIVLWAADITRVRGVWRKVSDATAAGGIKLTSPDAGWTSMDDTGVDRPLAEPHNYVEAAFDAPAGMAYHVWLRLRAQRNAKSNDSVWVQFSDAVTPAGAPLYRIGTTEGLLVNLDNCGGCGSSGWGWQDRATWLTPSYVQFAAGGTHVVRVQIREDGVELDQIVLTPALAQAPPPGPVVDDRTILPRSPKPSADVVIYASDVARGSMRGHWSRVSSSGSPQGVSLRTSDLSFRAAQPRSSPAHYVDVTFAAAAGVPYRVWVRLKAARNSVDNDSVWLQFTDTVSGSSPVYRIGTTGGFGVSAQTCRTCKPVNWVWSGGAPGLVQPGTVTFAWSGLHRLRLQTWEGGVEVDQVVLSPVRYRTTAPGSQKNDGTIVAKP